MFQAKITRTRFVMSPFSSEQMVRKVGQEKGFGFRQEDIESARQMKADTELLSRRIDDLKRSVERRIVFGVEFVGYIGGAAMDTCAGTNAAAATTVSLTGLTASSSANRIVIAAYQRSRRARAKQHSYIRLHSSIAQWQQMFAQYRQARA